MPGLLVSVRDAREALIASRAGVDLIDVKNPHRGPLGRADLATWTAILAAIPATVPRSAALGELNSLKAAPLTPRERAVASRFDILKLGLSAAGPDWRSEWAALRDEIGPDPTWAAVCYADWQLARSPSPDATLEAALEAGCSAVLLDTFDKSRSCPLDLSWAPWIAQVRRAGLKAVVAGRLTFDDLPRLAPLEPDLFAVRSAVCERGDRLAGLCPALLTELLGQLRSLGAQLA